MDLKTQKRIASFKAKERERRSMSKEPMTSAEKQRLQKLKQAKKKRPGFGSSVSSVADHLNEVVGLTERKVSKREERDKRIEAAAKSGAGCRRFEVAAAKSGASKFHGRGSSLVASSSSSSSRTTGTGRSLVVSSGRGIGGKSDQRMKDAREAFLARLEGQKSNQVDE